MRIREALGLRHEDLSIARREVAVTLGPPATPRDRLRPTPRTGPGDQVTRYRLTGGSVRSPAPSVERKDDDGEIARRVLNLLGDCRVLWRDFTLEIEEHWVKSANRVRDPIGVHLENPEIGVDLARRLQLLQRLFRDLVDEAGPEGEEWARYRTPGSRSAVDSPRPPPLLGGSSDRGTGRRI